MVKCRHSVKAAEDLVRFGTKTEFEAMVQSVTIKHGLYETRSTFERNLDRKISRKQLEDFLNKTAPSCEEIFRYASKPTNNKYLAEKGWPGSMDANNFTKRNMALLLCCKLYVKDWLAAAKALGANNVKLGVYIKPCHQCVDRKHYPKKCRQTQFWLKQGFPRDLVIPESTAQSCPHQ